MNSKSQTSHLVGGEALSEFLKSLYTYVAHDKVENILINKPNEIITDANGWEYHQTPYLTFNECNQIARLVANFSHQSISNKNPILSATLPEGERIQIVMPPATLKDRISFSIRTHSAVNFSLEDYAKNGAFDECEDFSDSLSKEEVELLELKKNRRFKEFLELAVKTKKNIIISGDTGAGKTTLMKALLSYIPQDERLISIENVDELKLYNTHKNSVALFYSAGKQGIADITQQQLLESSLRMYPSRIITAELIRGDEAFYYLRNVNSGHPGSITSMHAPNCRMAIEQLVLFIKESESGNSMSRDDIRQLLFMCVDVIVQIKRIGKKRVITEIYYNPEYKRKLIL